MTDKLPQNLLNLFAARPALRFLPAADYAPEDRRTANITGLAAYKHLLDVNHDPDWKPSLSLIEKKDRQELAIQERQRWLTNEGAAELYKPNEDKEIRGDAFKTLFVGRLSYDTEVRDLEAVFGRYGRIERVRIVVDNGKHTEGTKKLNKKGQSRGYGFIVFERESDMKAAYKNTGDIMIRNRRVCVDVERGRTVTGWRPRRFGGGLGGRHYTKEPPRMPGFGAPGGFNGFRGGGFRGNFRNDRGDRSGGFRGGRGGGRGGGGFDRGYGGIGYNGGPPGGAPVGPRANGGFDGGRNSQRARGGSGNERDDWAGSRYEDGPSRAGSYRDRDSGSSYNTGQKRSYDGSGYDESRSRRRY
nr:u1 small nuclear ribonucleoprotein 70 kda like [Quercus suber]